VYNDSKSVVSLYTVYDALVKNDIVAFSGSFIQHNTSSCSGGCQTNKVRFSVDRSPGSTKLIGIVLCENLYN
jgi:hypothetical protein